MPRSISAILTLFCAMYLPGQLPASVVFTSARLWPNGILYYTIDPAIPNPQRVLDAIQVWNTNTPLQILPRTAQPD